MHLISIFSPLEYLNTDKTSPELGSSHIAKLYFLPMQNSHPTPPKKKKRKKRPEYSLGDGGGGLKERLSLSENQGEEGSGQQPFPHCTGYCCGVTEEGGSVREGRPQALGPPLSVAS